MTRILIMFTFATAVLGCSQGEGQRCNPLFFTDECGSGLTCIYPTAPMCGVAYCCAVNSDGVVTDKDPNCQPDPTLSCAPDFSSPVDAGTSD